MKQKAKVLIEYQGNLLLLNPLGKEKRTLIGGTVDKGESVFQSVIREAGEEAGVQLDSAMLTIAYRQLVTINEKPVLFHCFLIRDIPFLFELKEKHKFQALDWIPIQDGIKLLKGVERIAAQRLYKKIIKNKTGRSYSIGA